MINLPTLQAKTHAWLRHVYTAAGVGVAVLGGFASMSPDDQKAVVAAVHQVGDGLEGILTGVGVLVAIGSALYARFTAKPESQVAAVNAMPGKAVVDLAPRPSLNVPGVSVKSSAFAPLFFLFLAVPVLMLGGCAPGQPLSTPEGKAATLGGAYATAKAGFAIYASLPDCSATSGALCKDPAVVAQVLKAETVSDVAVAKAQAEILAAQDANALAIAEKAGVDALAIFQQALVTYGVTAATTAAGKG